MNKKILNKALLTSLMVIMLSANINVVSAANPYMTLKIGHNTVESEVIPDGGVKSTNNDTTGIMGGISGGASFVVSDSISIRTELEYSYSFAEEVGKNESKNQLSDHKIFANGYVDYNDERLGNFTPYVGLGIGYTVGTWDIGQEVDVDGYGVGISIGTAYAITENFSADVGFRWTSMSRRYDETVAGKGDLDTDEMAMMLGARYAF